MIHIFLSIVISSYFASITELEIGRGVNLTQGTPFLYHNSMNNCRQQLFMSFVNNLLKNINAGILFHFLYIHFLLENNGNQTSSMDI